MAACRACHVKGHHPVLRGREDVLQHVAEDWLVVLLAVEREPLLVEANGEVGLPELDHGGVRQVGVQRVDVGLTRTEHEQGPCIGIVFFGIDVGVGQMAVGQLQRQVFPAEHVVQIVGLAVGQRGITTLHLVGADI